MYTFSMYVDNAKKADIKTLAALSEASLRESWTKESFEDAMESSFFRVLVARKQEEILGFCIFSVVYDEAELVSLAVRKDSRRCGIAGSLFSEMIRDAAASGAKTLYLEVRSKNEPAILFYKSVGMADAGKRPGFYSEPSDDALIFRLELL